MQEIKNTISYELYELDKRFKNKSNLINHINQSQDFYNGKQFPEGASNMIKTTMNFCKFMVDIKSSKLCGTPIYLAYTADNSETDCVALRQFDEYNCSKLNLEAENYQAAKNGWTNGTEITFIRWDDDDTSYKGIYKGGLAMEHIDPIQFAVANPYIQSIQAQEWVMFWCDMSVQELLKILEFRKGEKKEDKINNLKAEARLSYDDDIADKEDINHALVRVFTRYFRLNGEVYYTLETKTVEIFAYPHPLSRRVGKEIAKKAVEEYLKKEENDDSFRDEEGNIVKDFSIDYEDIILNSDPSSALSDDDYKNIKEKFSLYPFAVFEPIKVNRSFYGQSDVKAIIPIQMGVNFMISMMLKCAENNAYNKIFAKPDALQGQEITNEPSQVIVDYSQFTNGWGIKMAESQPMPNGLLDFVDRLFAMTRVVYGFNDVMDGSVTNQDMSGYMLQQMIKQSNTTIEQQQKLFWRYNVDMAEIRLMFYKHYVDKAKYTFEYSDTELEAEENARKTLYNKLIQDGTLESNPNATIDDFNKPTNKVQVREITNEEIYGVNFDISIDAMQGLADSKLIEQQMWDNLLLNGGIQNISPDILSMYLQASPNVSPRTKNELKRVVENLKQSTIQKQQQTIQELVGKLQEATEYIKQLDSKSKYQETYLKNLQNEFTNKINNQNKLIGALTNDLQRKTEGEVKSDNSRGVAGDKVAQE